MTIANRQAFNWTIGTPSVNRRVENPGKPPIFNIPLGGHDPGRWGYPLLPLVPVFFSNALDFATEGYGGDVGRMRVRDSEPGTDRLLTYEYSLTSDSGGFDAARASRFCAEANVPLLARFVPAAKGRARRTPAASAEGLVSVIPIPWK